MPREKTVAAARDNFLSARWVVVAGLLVAGYADLVRGGISWSAVLLTLAYLVAIPWALAGRQRGARADAQPYRWAAACTVVVFVGYLLTLAPSTALWDASEYIAAAYTFGLPHPPGNPLFVIAGRAISLLPIAPTVAMRINVLAAICSAASAGFWFLVGHRIVARSGGTEWLARLAGVTGAIVGATAFTVWNQSVVNEKVYTVSLIGIALVSWLMLRWSDAPDATAADRLLLVVAYLLGLGYSNHMAGVLPLPAAGLLILSRRPRTLLRPRLVTLCVLAGVLGVTPFATQPIRSAFHPAINEGEPTACRDGLGLSCTLSAGTWKAFTDNVNRVQYAKPALTERQAPFSAQLGMWWLYFKWQWLRDAHGDAQPLQSALAFIMLGAAALGAWTHYQRDRASFVYFGPLIASLTVVLIYYLNFKYGASQAPQLTDVNREVRDRDYFFLWSYSALGIWIGLGLVAIAQRIGGTHRWRQVAAAPVLLVALVPGATNWQAASRRDDDVTSAFARDLLNSVEPYGVIITAGDNDTFPLWYAQEVEGVRRDVTVAVTSLMNTDWFGRGIVRRKPDEYRVSSGPSVYANRTWARQVGSPLSLSLDAVDSVPQLMPVREPLQFEAPGIRTTIDPARLPQLPGLGPYLERADLLVLRLIADRGERPVYFSRTTGRYPDLLGLEEQTLAQGLARKVIPRPTQGVQDTVLVEGSGYLDVERSLRLWTSFEGPAAIIRKGDWVDPPSLSTVFAYIVAGSELGSALRARGDTTRALEVEQTVRNIARAVRMEQVLR